MSDYAIKRLSVRRLASGEWVVGFRLLGYGCEALGSTLVTAARTACAGWRRTRNQRMRAS